MTELSPADIVKEWAGKKTRPVCCLTGEERSFKDDAVKKLLASFEIDAFNFSEYDAETADINDLINAAMTPGLLTGTRLILLKGAEKLKKEPAAALAAYVKSPSDAAMLVIILDKKTDAAELMVKNLPDSAALVHFAPLEADEAAAYAKKLLEKEDMRVSEEALILLAEMCSSDAATIKQETAKLSIWRQGSKKQLEPEDIMESAGFSRTLTPFEFSNAMQAKNGPLASEIADKMMAEGMEPVGIAVSIAYIVEKLLKVKKTAAAGPGENGAYALGMNPGYYRRLLDAARAFPLEKLSRHLNRCLEVEALLKSSSGRDPRLLVKQLIFEITNRN
ncbi:MAG: DNA polymerase III subunit delta [Elusimicrobia bacterium RIFOXYA12_FULL_51_18]|nr:MAG: DNA polymerase III subunit delta [Elusimicrobia bacterium RIFOXYA12_FULL_51_18]OGS30776.1 MAG: DNA polymerase III subunit delta [Elusimicrobia bacterium RIFOXYA2_FULL_53_38]